MKILFDRVSSEYHYPLSTKEVKGLLADLPKGVGDRLRRIRFGCNLKTTQEARLTQRGNIFDIRVNFCLYDGKSLILSNNKIYLQQIKLFGGLIDHNNNHVIWNDIAAKKYCSFLIFHEVAHIVYCETRLGGKLSNKGSVEEEKWCDIYAIDMVGD